jgi:hypothetical protein
MVAIISRLEAMIGASQEEMKATVGASQEFCMRTLKDQHMRRLLEQLRTNLGTRPWL